jgi:hypothetical protein
MNSPMTLEAKRFPITHIKPTIWIVFIWFDMVCVQLDFSCSAILAGRFISANHGIYPLMMGSTTILAPCIFSVVWVIFALIPKSANIGARLRAKLLTL